MTNMFVLSTIIQSDTIQFLQNINDNIEAVRRIVDVSNSTIANEISSVNTLLVAFTIVLGIVGIGLSLYISCLQRKVSKMSDNIAEKEYTIVRLAKTVEETDKKIQSDISGLYERLRKEETMTLLRRLEEEPRDVSNLEDLLLARPLEDDGFPILKRAFKKLLLIGPEIDEESFLQPSDRKQYTLLFFQHFMLQSVLDEDLRPEIVKYFKNGMNCSFKRDIIKSTEDFCQALSVDSAPFDKAVLLADYLKALNQSKYSNLIELKNIFQEKINKDLLVNAIGKCTTDKVYLGMFGVEAPDESLETRNEETIEKESDQEKVNKS